MFKWMRKKREPECQTEAKWRIFNYGTDMEFAECSACGKELDSLNLILPERCPGCGAKTEHITFID